MAKMILKASYTHLLDRLSNLYEEMIQNRVGREVEMREGFSENRFHPAGGDKTM